MVFQFESMIYWHFTFRFNNSFLQTLLSPSHSPCLHADLLCFCSDCMITLQMFYCLHRFLAPALLLALKLLLSSVLLSDFCSAFLFFFVQQNCQNSPTNRKPIVVLTNEIIPGTLSALSQLLRESHMGGYSLTGFIHSHPAQGFIKYTSLAFFYNFWNKRTVNIYNSGRTFF